MPRPFVWLGKISYSLFVIHYTVCSFLMAILDGWIGTDPVRAVSVMMLAFFASIAAGALLFYGIEQPVLQWLSRKQTPQASNTSAGSQPLGRSDFVASFPRAAFGSLGARRTLPWAK